MRVGALSDLFGGAATSNDARSVLSRPGCRERSAPGLLTVGVVLLGFWGSLHAFQGMASPNRPSKPVARVETTLSPITVAFTDLAEQAGLNAVNVSGSEDRKRYILETTG